MPFRTLTNLLAALALTACAASGPSSTTASIATTARDTSAPNTGVLVIGGTGPLGSYTANNLMAAGEQVTILARETSSFERLNGVRGEDYQVVFADLRQPAQTRAAILQARPAVIIDISNVPGIRLDVGDSFYWVSLRAVAAAAAEANVTQIIRHSARGARQMLINVPSMFAEDERVVTYMRDIARAEIALETAAANTDGLNVTLVLNSNLPPEPATPTGNGELTDDLSANYGITRADLARLANTCVLNPACYNRTLNAIDPTLSAN
jgi:uncharacterized protein YbjT (DUF2867 family)